MQEEKRFNRNLLLIKIHCFLFIGGHAAVLSFTAIYAEQLGISAAAIGMTLAVVYNLTIVTKVVIGGIVDRFQILKQMIMFLIVVYVVADLGLNFLPTPYQEPMNITNGNFFCDQGNSYIIDNSAPNCSLNFENSTAECLTSCSLCQHESPYCASRNQTSSEATNLTPYNFENFNPNTTDSSAVDLLQSCSNNTKVICTASCFDGSELCTSVAGTNPPLQMGLISVLLTITYVACGSLFSLTDTACYIALGDQPQNYGKLRMWGNVGWGLCVLAAGYLNQVFTRSSKIYSYSSSFYMLVVLFIIDLLVLKMMDLEPVSLSKNICKDVGGVLVKPRIVIFILGSYVFGIIVGTYRAYFFWYLRTTLGASQLILGCTTGAECFLSELPSYYFSGLIIKKLGHINTITVSFIGVGMKSVFHSLLTDPWWAVLVELLEGISYPFFYTAATSYTKLVSPEGTEATVQGIVHGVFDGLGVATGSLFGGFCMDYYGGRNTFFWMGVMSFIVGIIHWLAHFIERYTRDKDCGTTDAVKPVEKLESTAEIWSTKL